MNARTSMAAMLAAVGVVAPEQASAVPDPPAVTSGPAAVDNSRDVTFGVSYLAARTETGIKFFCELGRPGDWEPREVCGSDICFTLPCGLPGSSRGWLRVTGSSRF